MDGWLLAEGTKPAVTLMLPCSVVIVEPSTTASVVFNTLVLASERPTAVVLEPAKPPEMVTTVVSSSAAIVTFSLPVVLPVAVSVDPPTTDAVIFPSARLIATEPPSAKLLEPAAPTATVTIVSPEVASTSIDSPVTDESSAA